MQSVNDRGYSLFTYTKLGGTLHFILEWFRCLCGEDVIWINSSSGSETVSCYVQEEYMSLLRSLLSEIRDDLDRRIFNFAQLEEWSPELGQTDGSGISALLRAVLSNPEAHRHFCQAKDAMVSCGDAPKAGRLLSEAVHLASMQTTQLLCRTAV